MHDPARLWSAFGLRSLSKDHALYGKDENYWRGPVWMPFNYMALSALYKVRRPFPRVSRPLTESRPDRHAPRLAAPRLSQTYMPVPGPHQAQAKQVYTELRANLVDNIFKVRSRSASRPCSSPSVSAFRD